MCLTECLFSDWSDVRREVVCVLNIAIIHKFSHFSTISLSLSLFSLALFFLSFSFFSRSFSLSLTLALSLPLSLSFSLILSLSSALSCIARPVVDYKYDRMMMTITMILLSMIPTIMMMMMTMGDDEDRMICAAIGRMQLRSFYTEAKHRFFPREQINNKNSSKIKNHFFQFCVVIETHSLLGGLFKYSNVCVCVCPNV